ncbi:hypothetical protein HPB50_013361 [Hyalomma asiaticum]|uniref:Uncharacterized protein n=1 Tax=Hyalomma asiaticum TaxID=266040 RepID=A0ACB7RNF8_HYAAI|nr:hypothetical protein HPB50_013361 [Hyalomma asiaticum]
MLSRYIILALLIVPLVTLFHQNDVPCARAEDEDEVTVETDAPADSTQQEAAVTEQDDDDEGDDSSSGGPLKPSPDGDTYMLFTKPQNFQSKLPAGKEVHFLVGFSNKAGQQFLGTLSKKKPASKQKVEMGTQSASDVDYDWLPKDINRSPKRSPRQSPRSRRLKRGTGSGEE